MRHEYGERPVMIHGPGLPVPIEAEAAPPSVSGQHPEHVSYSKAPGWPAGRATAADQPSAGSAAGSGGQGQGHRAGPYCPPRRRLMQHPARVRSATMLALLRASASGSFGTGTHAYVEVCSYVCTYVFTYLYIPYMRNVPNSYLPSRQPPDSRIEVDINAYSSSLRGFGLYVASTPLPWRMNMGVTPSFTDMFYVTCIPVAVQTSTLCGDII